MKMADKNIRKEVRKPKKSDKKTPVIISSSEPRPVVVQPELIKKERNKK